MVEQVELSAQNAFYWIKRFVKEPLNRLDSIAIYCEEEHLADKVIGAIRVLQTRRLELTSLHTIDCRATPGIIDAVMKMIEHCPAITRVSLGGPVVDGRGTMVPGRVVDFVSGHAQLKRLILYCLDFSQCEMQRFCQNISMRQTPIECLDFISSSLDESALSIFCETLPRMRLGRLHFACNATEAGICDLFEHLSLCREMTGLYVHIRNETTSPEMMSEIMRAIRTMPSLVHLSLTWSRTNVSLSGCVDIGRAIADCSRLESINFQQQKGHDPEGDCKANALLSELGPHPRLAIVHVLGAESLSRTFLAKYQSKRAKALTVLIAGATLERVGKRATCYKISLDVFRRLALFLSDS